MNTQHTKKTGATSDIKGQVKDAASAATQEAKARASDAASAVAAEAGNYAEQTKGAAADEVKGVSSALRTAAADLRSGSPQERTFSQLADGLADASEAIRDKDLGEIVGNLNDFARRNPLMFLGGAALVGFAATRFAKASGKPRANDASRNNKDAIGAAPNPAIGNSIEGDRT